MANLRKNFAINKNYKTEFNGIVPGGSQYIVEQNSGNINAPYPTYTPGSITYDFAGWADDLSASYSRTIYPDDNKTYSAFLILPPFSRQ
jgi:hypothetical protein